MSLSDIMAATGLSSWAEAGLIISFLTFVALVAYIFVFKSRSAWDEERLLPLGDDCDHTSATSASEEVELS